ncbi:MAG: arginine deiminase family protein [Candidatus Muiribacteriota bacterium]
MNKVKTEVFSEIGPLEAVLLHTPGKELENMTPENAERALYSDVLNLRVALKEYNQLKGVLSKICRTFEIKDLLIDILSNTILKENLVEKILKNEKNTEITSLLSSQPAEKLATQLIEGVVMEKNTLTKFLNNERFSLKPLHNYFFTRDSAITMYDKVLISKMASKVREREAIIMEAIFDSSAYFDTKTVNPANSNCDGITMEGGDIQIARSDVILCGIGSRTSSKGIDFIVDKFMKKNEKKHIIVQELPERPESFIHLDMVFTLLDNDKYMVFEPLILKPNRFQTVHITIDNGEVKSIKTEENIPCVLKKLGMDMEPVICGGNNDLWIQEREQWHSGANFFTFAPGKVMGYGRNTYTIDELNNHGFEVLQAEDIINDVKHPDNYKKCVVTIEGSELARGGGGCRCMTMPVRRKKIDF